MVGLTFYFSIPAFSLVLYTHDVWLLGAAALSSGSHFDREL
jgi:hypothetical protein